MNSEITIPIGISSNNDTISLNVPIPRRTHCFITGFPGSGKSTLLKSIIRSIAKDYTGSEIMLWVSFDCDRISNDIPGDLVFEIDVSYQTNAKRIAYFIDRVYNEAQRRIQIMSQEECQLFCKVKGLPLLIVVIDDFMPLRFIDYDRNIGYKMQQILRMSHAIGISFICASQAPASKTLDMAGDIQGFFNFRIALNASLNSIYEALDINPSSISTSEQDAVLEFSSGKAGDFIMYNRYENSPVLIGHFSI